MLNKIAATSSESAVVLAGEILALSAGCARSAVVKTAGQNTLTFVETDADSANFHLSQGPMGMTSFSFIVRIDGSVTHPTGKKIEFRGDDTAIDFLIALRAALTEYLAEPAKSPFKRDPRGPRPGYRKRTRMR